jgi:hypothetical protein
MVTHECTVRNTGCSILNAVIITTVIVRFGNFDITKQMTCCLVFIC